MAAPHTKKPRYGGPRISLQLTFSNLEAMDGFKAWLECMKRAFAPAGGQPLKAIDLMNELFNIAESHLTEHTSEVTQHLLPSSGIHIN